MRITDLLDKRSISLNETPKTKVKRLTGLLILWLQAERSTTVKHTEQVYAREEESTRNRRRNCHSSWKM